MTISKENWVFLSMIQSQDFNVSLNICDKSCQTAKPHKSNFSNSSVYRILHGLQSGYFITCLWENVKHRVKEVFDQRAGSGINNSISC